MKTQKLAILATTALVGNFFLAGGAAAQSTASTAIDTVVITGNAGPNDIGGLIQAETVAKARTTVDQTFIDTQIGGQTILQSLSVVTPGLNFTNNDPYGTSGGNIRLHGFDGNRVALTFDGMPLNDTGNYATFTNQLLDSELIASAQVNTGSTDVDSPTAASTGGTIGFQSLTPSTSPHAWAQVAIGDFAYRRYMAFAETGEFGPWGTRAWGAFSYQKYDKFKGEGKLFKQQFNAKIYQPLGDGRDFISLAIHYNQNRNNNYLGPNLAVLANPTTGLGALPEEVTTNPLGYDLDLNTRYQPITSRTRTGFAGDIDEDPAANGAFYRLRINPSNTGNVRGQSRFDFGDKLTLTVDPSFQYVLANGGTQNILLAESCNGSLGTSAANATNTTANCPALTRQLLGTANIATVGRDLNADGDVNDNVRVMNPSNTNTRRYGLLTSLIYRFNDDHLVRAGYTLDYGRHRQTGEFGYINNVFPDISYENVFGGKDGNGRKIATADGNFLRNRDRFSIAMLNQLSLEYRGSFDNGIDVSLGLRAPFFKRELNQYCYSQNGTSNVRCTTETPATTLANGNVTFAGSTTTQFIKPYEKDLEFDDLLPNIGASYTFGDSQFYGSYAESTSLPRTDNLYTVFRLADGSIGNPDVQPETSSTIEGGYRYDSGDIVASANVWATQFENRIVTSFDQDLGINIDRNVGKVEQYGIDAGLGWQIADELLLYASASYNDSEVQDDIQLSATTFARVKGKQLVETPEITWSTRMEYEPTTWAKFGAQLKYVGERWVTDVNDLKTDAYLVTDLDASFKFDLFGLDNTSLKFNVINLFDKDYYGSIGSTTTATSGAPGFSRPFAQVGAPRTFTVSLRTGY